MLDDKDNCPGQSEYSEAANRLHRFLSIERDKAVPPRKRSTALEDVLQAIWNTIVHDTLERNSAGILGPLDEAHVDGTIYIICNEYEATIDSLMNSRHVLKHMTYQIISKDLEDYSKAISFCRYEVMSDRGRMRLGYPKIGE